MRRRLIRAFLLALPFLIGGAIIGWPAVASATTSHGSISALPMHGAEEAMSATELAQQADVYVLRYIHGVDPDASMDMVMDKLNDTLDTKGTMRQGNVNLVLVGQANRIAKQSMVNVSDMQQINLLLHRAVPRPNPATVKGLDTGTWMPTWDMPGRYDITAGHWAVAAVFFAIGLAGLGWYFLGQLHRRRSHV